MNAVLRAPIIGAIAAVWLASLMLLHWQLPQTTVWWVAAVFSALMNLVYFPAAIARGQFVSLEAGVSTALIVLSLLGAVVSPWCVIVAVAAHGAWDLAKHLGVGVPFFSWYTLGCAVIDFVYAGLLAAYWLVG